MCFSACSRQRCSTRGDSASGTAAAVPVFGNRELTATIKYRNGHRLPPSYRAVLSAPRGAGSARLGSARGRPRERRLAPGSAPSPAAMFAVPLRRVRRYGGETGGGPGSGGAGGALRHSVRCRPRALQRPACRSARPFCVPECCPLPVRCSGYSLPPFRIPRILPVPSPCSLRSLEPSLDLCIPSACPEVLSAPPPVLPGIPCVVPFLRVPPSFPRILSVPSACS